MTRGLVLCLLLVPATARADRDRTWISAGGIFGGHDIGDEVASGGGAILSAGHSFGELHLVLEYSLEELALSPRLPAVSPPPPEAAQKVFLHTGAALVRWAWWRSGKGSPGYMDMAIEAGVGRSALVWSDGTRALGNELVLGASTQMLVNLSGGGAPRDWGVTCGLRVRVADEMRTSLLFFAGLSWGR